MIFIGYRQLDEPFGAGIPYSMLTEHFNTSHEVFLDTVPIARIARLRPEARAAEGLVAALERQAAALTARTGLPITVTGPPERLPLRPEAEEHLYRLALEALNN